MLRHAIAPASFFTQVSNEIIRHPRLSSDAIRLLTWQLSLPKSTHQPLSETAQRAGIKKTGFLRAKRQLVDEGFFHEWRLQGAGGRWSTTQLISNVPLSADEAAAVRNGVPTGEDPAVGQPKGQAIGHSPKNTKDNNDNPPSPPPTTNATDNARPATGREEHALSPEAPEPAPNTSMLPAQLIERGAHALTAVCRSERRLRLSGREIARLAPLAATWFQRSASMSELREALTGGLPDAVRSPAGLIRDRLLRKMPDVQTFAAQRKTGHQNARVTSRVAGTRECRGAHLQTRLFRPVADEVLCPECRCEAVEGGRSAENIGPTATVLHGALRARAVLPGATGTTA